MAEKYFIVYIICNMFLTCPSPVGHLVWLHNLVIVNSIAVNIAKYFCNRLSWEFLGKTFRKEQLDRVVDIQFFPVFKSSHTNFHDGYTSLLSHQPPVSDLTSLFTSSPAFTALCFLEDCHSNRDEMEFQQSFNSPSLMAREVAHVFVCLLSICISSLKNHLSFHQIICLLGCLFSFFF